MLLASSFLRFFRCNQPVQKINANQSLVTGEYFFSIDDIIGNILAMGIISAKINDPLSAYQFVGSMRKVNRRIRAYIDDPQNQVWESLAKHLFPEHETIVDYLSHDRGRLIEALRNTILISCKKMKPQRFLGYPENKQAFRVTQGMIYFSVSTGCILASALVEKTLAYLLGQLLNVDLVSQRSAFGLLPDALVPAHSIFDLETNIVLYFGLKGSLLIPFGFTAPRIWNFFGKTLTYLGSLNPGDIVTPLTAETLWFGQKALREAAMINDAEAELQQEVFSSYPMCPTLGSEL